MQDLEKQEKCYNLSGCDKDATIRCYGYDIKKCFKKYKNDCNNYFCNEHVVTVEIEENKIEHKPVCKDCLEFYKNKKKKYNLSKFCCTRPSSDYVISINHGIWAGATIAVIFLGMHNLLK